MSPTTQCKFTMTCTGLLLVVDEFEPHNFLQFSTEQSIVPSYIGKQFSIFLLCLAIWVILHTFSVCVHYHRLLIACHCLLPACDTNHLCMQLSALKLSPPMQLMIPTWINHLFYFLTSLIVCLFVMIWKSSWIVFNLCHCNTVY